MDEALIENPQDDVDGEERNREQNAHVAGRALESLSGPLKRALHALRKAQLALHAVDCAHRVAERRAGREVEGNSDCRQLTQMIDGERHGARRELRHGIERYKRRGIRAGLASRLSARSCARVRRRRRSRRKVKHVEVRWVGLILRQQFQHHPILVRGAVDRRNLLAAEGCAEGRFDLRGRDAKRGSAIAIDLHID